MNASNPKHYMYGSNTYYSVTPQMSQCRYIWRYMERLGIGEEVSKATSILWFSGTSFLHGTLAPQLFSEAIICLAVDQNRDTLLD